MSAIRHGAPLALGLVLLAACAVPTLAPPGGAESFRIGRTLEDGDSARRASTRLVMQGLDADATARPHVALQLYERSLQVDPTNPWAYLALARHRAEGTRPEQALPVLDQAEALAGREAEAPPGVEAHLAGLRGAALAASGRRPEGLALLERARRLAPEVWNDGWLDAAELR